MFKVLGATWALMLGMLLLMVGNGIQGTLLGIRGEIEGFSTFEISVVMSAYFVGFLGGSQLAPELIRRVGHVRVFAALGSLVSAILILYPAMTHPLAWTVGRVVIGFCFSGVYVTAESWLNNSVDNANRGKALSLYMIVQMSGIVAAQGLLTLGDPSGFIMFIVPSVLVSVSFAPILLSVSPAPAFGTVKRMKLRRLYEVSPLGCIGIMITGGVYSALFGMAAVYGAAVGLTVPEISAFIAVIYVGGLVCQFPIGWASDRVDRRVLILALGISGAVASLGAFFFGDIFTLLLVAAFIIGGTSNPLYALLLAYTNDYVEFDEMAATSGGLMFLNGIGAIIGPLATGWIMGTLGAPAYFLFLVTLMAGLSVYAAWRMTQRATPETLDNTSYAPILPSATAVALEEWVEDWQDQEREDDAADAAKALAEDSHREVEA
ncbi:MFS transporter [Tropicimonas sp. IMCC34011]|uniref:MFS transporter n=1 Tax=Tropicimonas sp. IMCC34011 TaxID=2248759 RepID=UPI000E27B14E|nr:MFS transporter [Tropicimonas sp. IMCC34011]